MPNCELRIFKADAKTIEPCGKPALSRVWSPDFQYNPCPPRWVCPTHARCFVSAYSTDATGMYAWGKESVTAAMSFAQTITRALETPQLVKEPVTVMSPAEAQLVDTLMKRGLIPPAPLLADGEWARRVSTVIQAYRDWLEEAERHCLNGIKTYAN